MNRNPRIKLYEQPEALEPDEVLEWPSLSCEVTEKKPWHMASFAFESGVQIIPLSNTTYDVDWANFVPGLVDNVTKIIVERKKQELRFNLLHIAITEFERRVNRLERTQTRIVPVNTFAPEPYELLKPIFVSVRAIDDYFEAGWFDANIHTTGDNEEEAVANLKSLILDYFDGFSNETPEKLGIEPTRQLVVMKTFISKKP